MAEVDSSVRGLALLHESTQMILSGGDLDTVLHQIVLTIRNNFAAAGCGVLLVDRNDPNVLYVHAHNGYRAEKQRFQIGQGIIGWAAESRSPVYVPDVSKEPRYICGSAIVRSEVALPLTVRDELLGVLDIESEQLDFCSPRLVELLSLFAGQAAVAIENARLYTTERRRMHQIELMNLIARSASAVRNPQELIDTIADLIHDAFDANDVAVLMSEAGGTLALRAHSGDHPPRKQWFSPEERKAYLSGMRTDDSAGCFGPAKQEFVVPMSSCGEVLGAMVVSPKQPKALSAEDRSIAQAAADVCATAIQNLWLSEQLHRVASTDPLTGLFNPRHFHTVLGEEIARAKRYEKTIAVAMLNLRRFRDVNESVGFDKGDEILCDVARALQGRIRSNDVVCRYAGDHFVFMFPETDPLRMDAVMEKLKSTVESFSFGPRAQLRHLQSTTAAAFFPADGQSEAELMRTLAARMQKASEKRAAAAR